MDILAANGIDEVAIRRPDGRLLHVATDDRVIAPAILRFGTYGADIMTAFLCLLSEQRLRPASLTFVNAGANIGTACLNAYDIGFRRFVAIEPEPRNFRLLGLNLSDLPGTKLQLMQAAAGARRGLAVLHRHKTNKGGHSLAHSPSAADSQGTVEVQVIRLDACVEAGSPFVLFVDVEGFEPQVMQGISDRIFRNCRALVLEITPSRYSAADSADLCRRLAAFAGEFHVLQTGARHPTRDLPAFFVETGGGQSDIALMRAALYV